MATIQIFGAPQSNFVWCVRMACEEKGVPYELVPARPHTPEIDAIHPFGKMPVLRHGEVALFESKAIATYIDRAFPGPKLIPDDALGAAQVEQWVSCINTVIDPLIVRTYLLNHVFPKGKDGQVDRAAIEDTIPAMRRQAEVLDRAVAATGYLAGAAYSLADINLMPILFYMQRFPESRDVLAAAGNLAGYFARHSERPAFRNTIPPPPPGK